MRRSAPTVAAAAFLACAALVGPATRADDASSAPAAAPGPAPPAPDPIVEKVEVRGEADAAEALDATAFATVILPKDFASRITSVPELLGAAVGVQVRSLGGEFATVSIRGSSAEQVTVYLDGVPLNRALGGGVNLADLPLAQVESITIYRGFTPAGLPAASIGGAVLIRTRRPGGAGAATAASVSFARGSFDTTEATASVSGASGRFEYAAGADAARSAADFRFFDPNGTDLETADDGTARRRNNDFRRGHLSARATLRASDRTRIDVTADLFRRDQGVPNVDADQSEHARFDTRRAVVRADLETIGLAEGRLLLRGALDGGRYTDRFDDPLGEVGIAAQRQETRSAAFGAEAAATFAATARQALSLLVSARRERAERFARFPAGEGTEDLGTAVRDTLAVTFEDQIAFAGGRFLINPSLRHERHANDDRHPPDAPATPGTLGHDERDTTGKIGFRARLGEGVALRGNAGRFVRVPSFRELFGDTGAVVGNSALLPERGDSFDVGVEVVSARRGARLEVSLFQTRADNLIIFEALSVGNVKARNSGRARIRGVEITGALRLGPRIDVALNATLQRAVNLDGSPGGDGHLLPLRPSREANLTAGLEIGRSRLFYGMTHVGSNYTDRQNTGRLALPKRWLHDVGWRVRLPHGGQAVFEVKNVGDDRVYDVARFPLPGRSAQARVLWTF